MDIRQLRGHCSQAYERRTSMTSFFSVGKYFRTDELHELFDILVELVGSKGVLNQSVVISWEEIQQMGKTLGVATEQRVNSGISRAEESAQELWHQLQSLMSAMVSATNTLTSKKKKVMARVQQLADGFQWNFRFPVDVDPRAALWNLMQQLDKSMQLHP